MNGMTRHLLLAVTMTWSAAGAVQAAKFERTSGDFVSISELTAVASFDPTTGPLAVRSIAGLGLADVAATLSASSETVKLVTASALDENPTSAHGLPIAS